MDDMTSLPERVASVVARDLTSREKFDALRSLNRSHNPPVEIAADQFVSRLQSSFESGSVPGIGDEFPRFILPDRSGALYDRDEFLQDRPAIISFNRGHWCFYCMLELSLMGRVVPGLAELGCRVLSIVPEPGRYTSTLAQRCQLSFPVLSDIDNGFGLNLGLTVALTSELRGHFYARNDDIGRFQGNDGWLLPVPATFLVDGSGIIRGRFVDPEYRSRMDAGDALLQIEAICAERSG